MNSIVLSALEKVFPSQKPLCTAHNSFSMLKNERLSFQIAFECQAPCELSVSVSGDFPGKIRPFLVGLVPVEKKDVYVKGNDFILNGAKPGMYPDILHEVRTQRVSISVAGWNSLWFELHSADGVSDIVAGEYTVVVCAASEAGVGFSENVKIRVVNAVLPAQELICTHWFHSDCLATYYGVEVFSEEHWSIVENYVRFAVKHGINFILTPLFTPPLDTEPGKERPTVQLIKVTKKKYNYMFDFSLLDRWIDMCERCGVKYFEMSHLFTQWGANFAPKIMAETTSGYRRIFGWETNASGDAYAGFLRQLAPALNSYIDSRGIAERCFFHVSDEPGVLHYFSYKRASALIRELFGKYKIIDAMSEKKFVERGLCRLPVPSITEVDKFKGKVPELWCYYCCGPNEGGYVNRFIHYPSLRNRVLGVLMYKYDIKGFLQWGYNFWYSVLSKHPINPYKDTTADGAFPPGDGFVVYPGENGEPVASVRLKEFYDGIQDMLALKALEQKLGAQAVAELLSTSCDCKLDFSHYPNDSEWLFALREKINGMFV